MSLAQILRRCADRFDPPPDNIPEPFEIPLPELGEEKVLDKTDVAQTPGLPGDGFLRRKIVYAAPDGGRREVNIINNTQSTGCGHNLSRSVDVAFYSMSSGLPVCKACERQCNRMRKLTIHEDCKCVHLVAPHELKRVEGHGYLCPECLKRHERFKLLKPIGGLLGLLLGLFLKPLIDVDKPEEVPYEELPPHDEYFPVIQGDPLSRSGHASASPPPYEVGRARPRRLRHDSIAPGEARR